MEKELYNTRVVPYVRYETRNKNGKTYEVKVDNLSNEEIRNMSCLPKIYERVSSDVYVIDNTPLTFRGTGLRGLLCYDFEQLTKEEQEKYFDRSIVIQTVPKSIIEEKKVANSRKPKSRIKER